MVAPLYEDIEEFFQTPILPRFGACDTTNCTNDAISICDDCEYMEHCRECINMFMDRSVSYLLFIEGSPTYTCIYCFVELQHGELQPSSSLQKRNSIEVKEIREQPGR
jgi:hypothetical protein